MERRAGFTLIELMIVVAVIAVIASFAIPALLGSAKSGKEAASISALRTLTTVSEQYNVRFGTYADSLNRLTTTGYIDSVLGSGTKSGYTYQYSATIYTWECSSTPEVIGVTGDRHFYVNQSGVIHVNLSGPASTADTPID